MMLAKNLQFSANPADILPNWLAHGWNILVEYQPDWIKNADFFVNRTSVTQSYLLLLIPYETLL